MINGLEKNMNFSVTSNLLYKITTLFMYKCSSTPKFLQNFTNSHVIIAVRGLHLCAKQRSRMFFFVIITVSRIAYGLKKRSLPGKFVKFKTIPPFLKYKAYTTKGKSLEVQKITAIVQGIFVTCTCILSLQLT